MESVPFAIPVREGGARAGACMKWAPEEVKEQEHKHQSMSPLLSFGNVRLYAHQ